MLNYDSFSNLLEFTKRKGELGIYSSIVYPTLSVMNIFIFLVIFNLLIIIETFRIEANDFLNCVGYLV